MAPLILGAVVGDSQVQTVFTKLGTGLFQIPLKTRGVSPVATTPSHNTSKVLVPACQRPDKSNCWAWSMVPLLGYRHSNHLGSFHEGGAPRSMRPLQAPLEQPPPHSGPGGFRPPPANPTGCMGLACFQRRSNPGKAASLGQIEVPGQEVERKLEVHGCSYGQSSQDRPGSFAVWTGFPIDFVDLRESNPWASARGTATTKSTRSDERIPHLTLISQPLGGLLDDRADFANDLDCRTSPHTGDSTWDSFHANPPSKSWRKPQKLEEAHKASHVNRTKGDQLLAEAEDILKD